MPVKRYRKMHERGTLPKWCAKVIKSRPVPMTLVAVVMGRLTIMDIAVMEKTGFEVREFEREDPYWYVKHKPEDPMHEYRELMRNDLAEAQIHERERKRLLHAALRFQLAHRYDAA